LLNRRRIIKWTTRSAYYLICCDRANTFKGDAEGQPPAEESKKDDDETSSPVVDQPPKVANKDNDNTNEMSLGAKVDADSGLASRNSKEGTPIPSLPQSNKDTTALLPAKLIASAPLSTASVLAPAAPAKAAAESVEMLVDASVKMLVDAHLEANADSELELGVILSVVLTD
jgi:hypothetical protein